ncbi:MAG: ABC transporter ATP-binding protein [Candidatus Bathyarchaeota archaeon]|nr:MAG: ABC transporter ATP-binding protein [Candidatus Bathyarchaeota archaeon]
MKLYTASFIEKSQRPINATLAKQLISDYRRSLKIPRSAVSTYELNTFTILSAEKNGKEATDTKTLKKIEEGKPRQRLSKYYHDIRSRFRKYLKHNQELRETSRLVKHFLKEVDPNLARKFSARLEQIIKDLPLEYYEIYSRSHVILWDFKKNQKYRIVLSAFDSPIFTGSTRRLPIDLGRLFDKLMVANFFAVFLEPTITRLQAMDQVLEELEDGIEGAHYRSTDQELQIKQEWFLRILEAKLSALQDMEGLISRVFNLFRFTLASLRDYSFENDSHELNKVLEKMKSEVVSGRVLLSEVSKKLQQRQIRLRDYLDEEQNEVRTTGSVEEFKRTHLKLAELSIDLFAEAELLKIWVDSFASDLPYFSFGTQLFDSRNSESISIPGDTILAVRGLVKNYSLGRTTAYAVRGIDLDIKEGEFVAIVGNSGAGKTTLLNCMAGLDAPDHGVVLFHGENLHEKTDSEKSALRLLEMGFIFQSYALLPHFNTRENVALPADLAGFSENLRKRIEDLLEDVGIDQQAEQYPAQLSGGQMQRVAIARALTNRPKVIFADEPTGDLDSVTGKQVMDLLKKFHEETKTTVIVITHEQDVADYAERQVVMEDGVIAAKASQLSPRTTR